MSKNTNCLEGIRCPKCGYEDDFKMNVTVRATVLMSDDGYDINQADDMSTDWDDDDWIMCGDCDHEGVVEAFYTQNQEG